MFGSDNVCYVFENKGLNGFDTVITFPKLQAAAAGESSVSSREFRKCERCSRRVDFAQWTRRERDQRSGRFCGVQCARAYAGSCRRAEGHRGPTSIAAHLSAAERNHTRAVTQRLVRRGVLIVPSACQDCACRVPLESHHVSYDDPTAVRWLCRWCHRAADWKARHAS